MPPLLVPNLPFPHIFVSLKSSNPHPGIAEVEILQSFVVEGAKVKMFDKVCEVQSDKATVDITSRYEGLVTKVHFQEGSIVKVGESLIDVEETVSRLIEEEESPSSITSSMAEPTPTPSLIPTNNIPIPFVPRDLTLLSTNRNSKVCASL